MDYLDMALHPRKAMQRFSPLRKDLTEGQENELSFMFNRVRRGEHRNRIVGERTFATHDPVIRAVYSEDVASLPKNVDMLIKRLPGSVVMPRNKGDLLELLRFGKANGIPLTPRAGGTSGYGGAVPTEGGIVCDLRSFNQVVDVDKDRLEVRLQPGITWLDLEKHLDPLGLATRCYPTSAPFATVGGWVAMGGGGVGSYQFGTIRHSLVEATVLTPDQEVVTFRGEDLDLVEGCEGTTGFILELVLKVRARTAIVPVAAGFDSIEQAHAYVNAFGVLEIFSVHLLGPEFLSLKQEAFNARQLPKDKFVVLTALHDTSAAQVTPILKDLCAKAGGEWMKDTGAQWEWDTRFQHVNFKRFGPGLVAAEAICATSDLAPSWTAARAAIRAPEACLWGIAIGKSEFDLLGYLLADPRMPAYPLAAGSALAFIDAVKKRGGRAYSPGVLLTKEAKNILGKDRVRRLAKWKRAHDKAEIMNPGKVLPARIKGAPIVPITLALAPGEAPLKWMRGQFEHRRGSTTEASIRAVRTAYGRQLSPRLARLADGIYKCSRVGHTNRVGGLHRQLRFDTQLPRGILRAAQVMLEGQAEPTLDLVSHALSLPCVPAYDRASQNGTPIFETIEAVREAAQKRAGLDPRVAAIVDTVASTGNVLGKPKDKRGAWMPGAAPSGVDTTTLLLAGDVGAYERTKDAAAAFTALIGCGFGFTTLGATETHPGTITYRLGAFADAATSTQAWAEAVKAKLKGRLPETVVTLSSEDADVLRRRLADLLDGSDIAWTPRVLTFAEAIAGVVTDKRLTFKTDAGALDGVVLHSPFATDAEKKAVKAVLDAAGVKAPVAELGEHILPDLAFSLTHPDETKEMLDGIAPLVKGKKIIIACLDLALVLKPAKLDLVTLPQIVAERMQAREGAAVAAPAPATEAKPEFNEHEIPEGAFRVELVKEKAAIPVFPDESILDAAEKLGYEMPFDCRAGSCVTCCGRWEGAAPDQREGQVLSADEQKKYALTCIAKPKGPVKVWSGEKP